MEMQGTRPLAVTQEQAWEALNDPQVLKQCIPGCDKIEPAGEGQYAVGIAVKVGPVSAKFNGKIALSEVVAPDSYTLTFDGQGGAAGFGKGVSKVRLSAQPDGPGCVLDYQVQAQVGGKIAQVGQRLIDGVARSMAEDFFKRFDAQMRRLHPEAYAQAESAAAETAVMAGGAVPFAALPPAGRSGLPTWTWMVALALAVLLAVWLLR